MKRDGGRITFMNILTNQCPHSASRDHNCVAGREGRKSERQKDARGETGEILLLIGKRVDDGHRRICKNGPEWKFIFHSRKSLSISVFRITGRLFPSPFHSLCYLWLFSSWLCLWPIHQRTTDQPTDRSGPSMSTVITCIWEPRSAAPNHQI